MIKKVIEFFTAFVGCLVAAILVFTSWTGEDN